MDTRFSRRIDMTLKVILKIEKNAKQQFSLIDGNSFDVVAFDISATGVGIFSKHFLPKGLIIGLEMDNEFFGLDGVMSMKAEIRYCNFTKASQYKCGLKFIDISKEYTSIITNFISENERRKSPRIKLSDN